MPEDFHLRKTNDGFYRKWDNTRSWSDAWQIQQLGLADLIDIAQSGHDESEFCRRRRARRFQKVKFVRDASRPWQYCYLPDGTYVGFSVRGNGITTALINANPGFYSEYVQDYLGRAARWLVDRTRPDGLRLDAANMCMRISLGLRMAQTKDLRTTATRARCSGSSI